MRLNRGLNNPLNSPSDPLFDKLKAIKEAIHEDNEKYEKDFNNLNEQPNMLSVNKSGTSINQTYLMLNFEKVFIYEIKKFKIINIYYYI